jgi:clan AA aspartic protease
MGHVHVKARLRSPTNGREREVDALVDTRATLTVIPRAYAEELGLARIGTRQVRTASGAEELEETFMLIDAEGRTTTTPTLISPKVDRVLLGVLALEALELKVNPTTGRLERAELLLM